ncbi:ester hydrolase C11orf54 homolog [Anoplolepis gracilipes]|uniref:ester hydrolase C11orf54 homolog n=1 Tax=Anoplolepis gracilipes TaxID=354296 RepID=UPI003B9E5BC7
MVLLVYVKKRSPRFAQLGVIEVMQNALQEAFGMAERLVVLGGVYTIKNAVWNNKLFQYIWERYNNGSYNLRSFNPNSYCVVDSPITGMSIINSLTNVPGFLEFGGLDIYLNTNKASQYFYHHSVSDQHFCEEVTEDDIEFLGYFCPAQELYRIDQRPDVFKTPQ